MSHVFDRGCADYQRQSRASRRNVLTAGALGAVGLSLPDLLRVEAAAAAPKREMSCIFLWLRGGPSAIDMWDMKPEAPAEVRGPFKPIRTNVAGIQVSEHLPLCAKIADKYTLVRAVTHPSDDHELASHINSTGWGTWPAQPYPMFGTVVQKLLGYQSAVPPHVHLPEPPQTSTGGRHYLAQQDLPFTISCVDDLDLKVRDVSPAAGVDRGRFNRRRQLLAGAERESASLRAARETQANDVFYQRAFEMLTAPAVRSAFDLTQEPGPVRDRYGRGVLAPEVVAQGNAGDVAPNDYNRTIIGQSLLMARRLVEAGTRFVTVIGRGWDTHADNFNRLEKQLLPPLDRALSALLTDLEE
ncbi:MAG TPA: DUF1501 domain-containing protein, partial [Armatimonadota bacterium]|nr:DUF1501 domain-containing protein [Armatimonadota bacterium]